MPSLHRQSRMFKKIKQYNGIGRKRSRFHDTSLVLQDELFHQKFKSFFWFPKKNYSQNLDQLITYGIGNTLKKQGTATVKKQGGLINMQARSSMHIVTFVVQCVHNNAPDLCTIIPLGVMVSTSLS